MLFTEKLFRKEKGEYGEQYAVHYLEQYKMYFESAERISDRRNTANTFLFGMNTLILGALGYLFNQATLNHSVFTYFLAVLGILISYAWYRLIRSYKDLNTGKFKVIHAMEQNLPMAPFDAEWEAIGRGENPKLYLPFTHIEIWIPRVFFVFYVLLFLGRMVYFLE